MAKGPRSLLNGELKVGQTAGVRQEAVGSSGGQEWLRLSMVVSVALDELEEAAMDRVHISGTSDLTATISPGAKAVPGTIARIVNSLPVLTSAAPGVYNALSLGITPARSG